MTNNPAQDRYNPPSVAGIDWEEVKYYDMGNGTLFWLSDKPEWNDDAKAYTNEAYRKLDDKQALNTKNQVILDVLSNINVFTKI